MERIHMTIRLPLWLKEWLDYNTTDGTVRTRTDNIEYALKKAFRLKEPK